LILLRWPLELFLEPEALAVLFHEGLLPDFLELAPVLPFGPVVYQRTMPAAEFLLVDLREVYLEKVDCGFFRLGGPDCARLLFLIYHWQLLTDQLNQIRTGPYTLGLWHRGSFWSLCPVII
jgi:hypothetical protein